MSIEIGRIVIPSEPLRGGAAVARARLCWLGAMRRVREKLRQRRQLDDLLSLDDRLLADIGITREQAARAARRASWMPSFAL